LAQAYTRSCWPQDRITPAIKAFKHLNIGKRWKMNLYRFVQCHMAPLNALENSDSSDRLRKRSNSEYAIYGYFTGSNIFKAERAGIQHSIVGAH
jgi:hypothetical protein